MKKSILYLVCILGLGLSCVFGVEMGDMGPSANKEDNRMIGPMTESQSLLTSLKDYVVAYQYFKALASSAPSQEATSRAVDRAQNIVRRQDAFVGKLRQTAQRLKNVKIFSSLSEKIEAKKNESNTEMQALAKEDLMKANSKDKKEAEEGQAMLWGHIRKYRHDIRNFHKELRALHKKIRHAKAKVGMAAMAIRERIGEDGDEFTFEEEDENDQD